MAAVEQVEAPPAAAGYRPSAVQRLPYPVRNVLRRWRGTLGMMLGVGIALGVTMTMLAVSQGSIDFYTLDYKRSAANLYVVTEGGNLIPVLPSDQPGTIDHAQSTLARVRGWPEVAEAVGVMNWSLEREQEELLLSLASLEIDNNNLRAQLGAGMPTVPASALPPTLADDAEFNPLNF